MLGGAGARVPEAGAIAFRGAGPKPHFLLVTAKHEPAVWIFPKGHLEPGETPAGAALRELREEAGVTGKVVGEVGTLDFRSGREDVSVTYYLIRHVNDGAPPEGRSLAWLPYDQARARLSHDDARGLLDTAMQRLRSR